MYKCHKIVNARGKGGEIFWKYFSGSDWEITSGRVWFQAMMDKKSEKRIQNLISLAESYDR
jgi:hypothetical protein